MLQPWQTGKVIRIENATAATRRFWIELSSGEPFQFEPGQFVTLDLPIHEKPSRRWRSYSIASWPDESPVFELVIVLLEGGAGTKYLFEEIQVGSELPFGDLRDPLRYLSGWKKIFFLSVQVPVLHPFDPWYIISYVIIFRT